MKRMFLLATMLVAALSFTIDASAQTEKKEVKKQKLVRVEKRDIARKAAAVQQLDATTAATEKAEQATERKCDGCKKGDGNCPKAKAAAEKKDCCKKENAAVEKKDCCKKDVVRAENKDCCKAEGNKAECSKPDNKKCGDCKKAAEDKAKAEKKCDGCKKEGSCQKK